MRCQIPQQSIKIFSKTISCICKIGEEITFEMNSNNLNLSSINQARSAFCNFKFSSDFFNHNYEKNENALFDRFSINSKACTAVFRNVSSIENCTISLSDGLESVVIFELQCKLGIKKTYRLSYEIANSMKPVCNKERCSNRIVLSQTRSLDESIKNNFHTSVEEITFIATENYLRIKSYIDEEAQRTGKKILHTQIDMQKTDFGQYLITPNNEITFSLKMLKYILDFCENAGQPVTLCFDQSGQPLILSLNYFSNLDIEFVLATLFRAENESDSNNSHTTTTTNTTTTSTNRNSSQIPSSTNSSPPSSSRDNASSNMSNVQSSDNHHNRSKRNLESNDMEDESSSDEYVESTPPHNKKSKK
eukprot:TRINITY_DN4858_c0_g1_i1.p1 TRINITY_DN4858_c0_g1~~TRINITY_DN4858_c0_g1_i1.p1  ORF type:complete len:362 (+),score=73.57 TRINITY_DN4858_c0_g1_i1:82-1167(+)